MYKNLDFRNMISASTADLSLFSPDEEVEVEVTGQNYNIKAKLNKQNLKVCIDNYKTMIFDENGNPVFADKVRKITLI